MFFIKAHTKINTSRTFLNDTQKYLSTLTSYISKNSNNLQNKSTECLVEDNILFNSVLESKRIKVSNFQARKAQIRKTKILETIQPLPVSLKFLSEDTPTEKIKNCNVVQTHEYPKNENIQFPFSTSSNINEIDHSIVNEIKYDGPERVDREIRARNENLQEWMNAYDNLECDIIENGRNDAINYGTPDPNSEISNVPCGGCGALLHCKDTAIPGYIPSEIFKNANKHGAANLEAIICQRCFFLKEHDIALQVRVSPDDYPKVLMSINNKKALMVLMVDLTDFPCSIWPGIADILGPKIYVHVVGNKVDLLPKDNTKFLAHIKQKLYEQMKICGFGTSNILNVSLISAKTGYGVEDLITSLQKQWQVKDVYIVGCTNVGKSSLFNALLQSDYCKFQASDLIQRATTSQWPGTTLNLLKFPIMRVSEHRIQMRNKRLINTNRRLAKEEDRRQEQLKAQNTPANATLIGRIERTFSKYYMDSEKPEKADSFITQVNTKATGIKMGLRENHPDFNSGRWCYDTPGVVHPDQILDLLTLDELILTLPKELIRPETFCVRPGTSLFIAGLARLDYINGPETVRLTVFRSNDLPITICTIDAAEKIYNECIGTDLFKVPIAVGDRLKKWPHLQAAKQFIVKGIDKRFSSKDVVLSNAGWIAIKCAPGKEFSFQAWTPNKRGIHLRECILPKAVTLKGKKIRSSVAYMPHRFI